jgi:predicted lipoprotein with Yx(FWY)xxD motif
MTIDPRRSLVIPALIAIAAIAAACSSGGGAATQAPVPSIEASAAPSMAASPSEAASPAESAAASPAAGGSGLALADNAKGKIIVDGAGKTLYLFLNDEGGTPSCYDQCATNWPPLTATDAASVTVGAGLDASKVSVVDRTDGTKQVKYGEYPLYYFKNDAAAGDVNGQGLNSKWYVVGADGEAIKN